MKKLFLTYVVIFAAYALTNAQTHLIIEAANVTNNETGHWEGVYVPRTQPTAFTYRNNSVTSVNTSGYMLQAGDEGEGSTNNNLSSAVISGNKYFWNGSDLASITHGIFTGYNINTVIRYNYLHKIPMSIVRKSNGMTNTSGGIAYNIVISPNVGLVVKGMNGVQIFNNTLYSERTPAQTHRALVDIYANDSFYPPRPSTGAKVFNNIFYTKHQIMNIRIETVCLPEFESDYNIFYCEGGTPMFEVGGVNKTFAQWQAMGYDTHSIIVNPNFKDFVSFIPNARLDYGTDLGPAWQAGLALDAVWGNTDPATTNQNGIWQVGARIFPSDFIPEPGGNIKEILSIYPNPAQEFFTVTLNNPDNLEFILKIFDSGGKVAYTDIMLGNSKNIEVPEDFVNGIYIVTLSSGLYYPDSGKLLIQKKR